MENQFQQIALLIGDRARSCMLWNLLDGKAYTATELSLCANISAQAASNHLFKMVEANILKVEKQGRHRYYRYATDEVARIIETLASLSSVSKKENKEIAVMGIKYARTCYDHMAGKLGVDILQALLSKRIIHPDEDGYKVTDAGIQLFDSIGIDVESLYSKKRTFAYPCLDWSERKHHLAGALGAGLLHCFLHKDWVRKVKHSRELIITAKGKSALEKNLHLSLIA